MSEQLCIDVDVLKLALNSSVFDDGYGGCQFEALESNAPDHHGAEFAQALFDALKAEVADIEKLRGSVR